jgi:hypothetical protein
VARIRSVKPEFWVDRSFVRKVPSRDTRMLYMALWNLADEHARVMGDAAYLKGHIFPYAEDADLSPDVIDKMIDDLAAVGKVIRYEADGDPYLFLPTLHRHQRLESKVPSRLPAPPGPDGGPGSGLSSVNGATVTQLRLPAEDHAHESASHADVSERHADPSAPDADKFSLLYVAGSMEQVAGSMDNPPAPDVLFGVPDPAVPTSESAGKPRRATRRKAAPKGKPPIDPEVAARNKLAVDLVQEWYDAQSPKPTGKFVAYQQIAYRLLAADHDADAIAEAFKRCGFALTLPAAEFRLKKIQEERERVVVPFQRRGEHQPYRNDPTKDISAGFPGAVSRHEGA